MAKRKRPRPGRKQAMWLIWIIEGIIIGGGAILPGISGGVLAVTFGLYRPMMAALSHPRETIPKYWNMFLFMILGWILGFWVFAKGINAFFNADSSIAVSLFAGLVAGSVPQLFLEAGKQGSCRRDWVGFTLTLFLAVGCVVGLDLEAGGMNVTPNWLWFLFCGALWGLSLVVPGMTSSSTLIWLGLFQPLTEGISSFRLQVLVPFLVGIAAVALLTARLVNAFFEKCFGLASRMILAVVIASSIAILPTGIASLEEAVRCIAMFGIGFAAAWAMDKFGKKPEETGK